MKKYGNDYRQNGKQFEYTGKWYGSSLSVKELKRHALNNTGLMAAALVIYFASLMLNNEGSRIFWILLPYMVVVFPVSYGIMGGASLFLFCFSLTSNRPKTPFRPHHNHGHAPRLLPVSDRKPSVRLSHHYRDSGFCLLHNPYPQSV